jgi:hypothetical protein
MCSKKSLGSYSIYKFNLHDYTDVLRRRCEIFFD